MRVQEIYGKLRDEFISAVKDHIDQNILFELKNIYADEIDSKRKLSRVKDLDSLIQILETRDILNYDNITPLYLILNKISKESLLETKLKEYSNWLQTVEIPQYCNMYVLDNLSSSPELENNTTERHVRIERQTISMLNTSVSFVPNEPDTGTQYSSLSSNTSVSGELSEREQRLQQAVLLYISERLGRSWRAVARFLNVREHCIDQIQTKHPFDLKEQCYEALKLGMSQYHSSNWKISLIHALEKGRRKDLKETVEEMILKNEHN